MSSFGVPRTLCEIDHATMISKCWCLTSAEVRSRPSALSPMHSPENPEDLVNLGITREQRLPHRHLCKDTSHGPHVDRSAVVSRTKEDFGSSIPESDDLQRGESEG